MLFLMYVVFLCVVSLCMLFVLRIVCCISVFIYCFINVVYKLMFVNFRDILNIFRLINFKFGNGRGTSLGVLVLFRL